MEISEWLSRASDLPVGDGISKDFHGHGTLMDLSADEELSRSETRIILVLPISFRRTYYFNGLTPASFFCIVILLWSYIPLG